MAPNNKRPNILWLMTDQHKTDALSFVWDSLSDAPYLCKKRDLTPNLDALAADGCFFPNAYCPSPVCGPARASMKTGKYPPATGAVKNWKALNEDNTYLPILLRDGGYETGMSGKLHFFPPEEDYGFQVRHLSDAPYSVYWEDDKHSEYIKWLRQEHFDAKGIDPVALFNADESAYDSNIKQFIQGSFFRTKEEHETGWTTERAIDFLEHDWDGEKPFFFYTSYFGPHQPYGAPDPYNDFVSPDEILLPESYYTDFKKGCPIFEEKNRALYNHIRRDMTEQDVKEVIASYLGQVHMIDESIGELIRYLKEKGLYDNTFIIFSSDHGDHLGEHGLFFKGEMYDSCAKVPLIIKPAGAPSGRRRSEVVNTIDLFQTVLDAAQIDWKPRPGREAEYTESRSLMPLLSGDASQWDNETYSIIGDKRDSALCMVRRDACKLIRLAHGPKDAVYEMYDLEKDPDEHTDVYERPEYRKVRDCLQKKLDAWFQKQYPCFDA